MKWEKLWVVWACTWTVINGPGQKCDSFILLAPFLCVSWPLPSDVPPLSLGATHTLEAALKVNHTPHGRRSLTAVKMLIPGKIDLTEPMAMTMTKTTTTVTVTTRKKMMSVDLNQIQFQILFQIRRPSSLTTYITSACELLGSGLTLIAYKYTRDSRQDRQTLKVGILKGRMAYIPSTSKTRDWLRRLLPDLNNTPQGLP